MVIAKYFVDSQKLELLLLKIHFSVKKKRVAQALINRFLSNAGHPLQFCQVGKTKIMNVIAHRQKAKDFNFKC